MHERRRSPVEAWARFRLQVIGSLLAAPPGYGELSGAVVELARREWRHPTTGHSLTLARSTIERWYYAARDAEDPLGALRSRPRRDAGSTRRISGALEARILAQHRDYPHWSYRLHYDNLAALLKEEPELGEEISYSTLRRFMKSRGLLRVRRRRARDRDAERASAESRFESREVRSYEVEHVGALWHLDFHHGSIPVLDARGQWRKPIALGVIDDHSRHLAHLQWYFGEGAEELVHGVSQAIQKCGLPRAILSDNGAAMSSAEFREGLERLGVRHETTVAYSPHQNGKQEVFWATLEGRLVTMLDRVEDLTLEFLERATLAWLECDYHRTRHEEIRATPLERFTSSPSVLRQSPSSLDLRRAFRMEVSRRQRRSDGTVSIDGKRFEVPSRFRHFDTIHVRYARWRLDLVDMVDPRTGSILAPLYPLDRARNADGRRRVIEPREDEKRAEEEVRARASVNDPRSLPPFLRRLLANAELGGRPALYIPHEQESARDEDRESESDENMKEKEA